MVLPTGFQTIGGRAMAAAQAKIDALMDPQWKDATTFAELDRERAIEIIDAIEQTMEFDDAEFEWDAMRGLIDYYSDVRAGGDGSLVVLAETGRQLTKAGSGDKSGRSILGTTLRSIVLDPARSKPALVLLQQEGTREQGWSGHKFWWPILAAPGGVEPCIFATKVAT
jgi:hypothetical protein